MNDKLIMLVAIMATADILSGTYKAWVNHNIKSKTFKYGLASHIMVVLGLYVLKYFAGDLGATAVVDPIALGFIVNYFMSLFENYRDMGGTVPDVLAKRFSPKKEEKEK